MKVQKTLFVGVIIMSLVTFSSVIYSKKKLKIFNPQMKPTAGQWGSPAHRVGEKPKTTWSTTTVNAAVNNKPLGGKLVTKVGEIIDISCYNQLGKHGASHAGCAKACILNGQPMGLLEEDGTVYLIIPEEHDPRKEGKTALREVLIHHVSQIVELTATLTRVPAKGGMRTLYVHGFVKKK
jgi:hypothetical protein